MKAFTHIPTLREMIHNDGTPGCEYAIVEQANLFKAQQEGWDDITGGTLMFPIKGPKGEAHCKLLGRGKPIPGQIAGIISPLHVDISVKAKTGLGAEPKPA